MAEPEKRIVLEEIEFGQLFRFPRILRAVTMAFQPPKLILGLVLVAALMSLGRAWDGLSTPSISPHGLAMGPMTASDEQIAQEIMHAAVHKYLPQDAWPDAITDADSLNARGVVGRIEDAHRTARREIEDDAERQAADDAFYETVLNIHAQRPRGIFEATTTRVTDAFNMMVWGVVTLELADVYSGAGDLVTTPVALWRHDPFFISVYGLAFLVLIAIIGGAIARMTAVEVATGEKLRVQDGVEFAVRASRRLIFSLLLPLVIAAVICIVLVLAGALLMLPGIGLIGGLLYGLALVLGFGVVFLLVGYAIGFSLLVPAVACENCDAADAQQRAYAYVLSRPLHLVGYIAVAAVGLALGYTVISAFAAMVLDVTGGHSWFEEVTFKVACLSTSTGVKTEVIIE